MMMESSLVWPSTLDYLHVLLLALCVLSLALCLARCRKRSEQTSTDQPSSSATPSVNAPSEPTTTEITATASPTTAATAAQNNPTQGALQLLSLLQKEARFIDFLHEDLSGFADADIGTAARVVHRGAQKVLQQYFTIEPIRTEAEESSLDIPSGYDATRIHISGHVSGTAPFHGTLLHRGWEVHQVDLPQLIAGHNPHIIMPAEVEL